MAHPLFERLLLPVADEEDAQATVDAVKPYVEAAASDVIVLHITETSDDSGREDQKCADAVYAPFIDTLDSESVTVETIHRDASDPFAEIAAVADEIEATLIGVLPRPRTIFLRMLSREQTTTLISSTDVPVVVFPDHDQSTGPSFRLGHIDTAWTTALLVPLGGSERSFEALEFACSAYTDATITALHVIVPPDTDVYSTITPGVSKQLEETQRERERESEEIIEEAKKRAEHHGVELQTRTITGDVADGIVTAAETQPTDAIVVGTKLDSNSDRPQLGSVLRQLIRNAPVPVIII